MEDRVKVLRYQVPSGLSAKQLLEPLEQQTGIRIGNYVDPEPIVWHGSAFISEGVMRLSLFEAGDESSLVTPTAWDGDDEDVTTILTNLGCTHLGAG